MRDCSNGYSGRDFEGASLREGLRGLLEELRGVLLEGLSGVLLEGL